MKLLVSILLSCILTSCYLIKDPTNIEIEFNSSNLDLIDKCWETINKRLDSEGVIIENVNAVSDSTFNISIKSPIDSLLLKNLLEYKGEYSLHETVTYFEISKIIDNIFLKINQDKLIPFNEDKLLKTNFSDIKNYLFHDTTNKEASFIAYTRKKDQKLVDSIINLKSIKSMLPENTRFIWSISPTIEFCELFVIKNTSDFERRKNNFIEKISYKVLNDNSYDLIIVLKSRFKKSFYEFTRLNNNKAIAFIVDENAITCPKITQPIKNGRFNISINTSKIHINSIVSSIKFGPLSLRSKAKII